MPPRECDNQTHLLSSGELLIPPCSVGLATRSITITISEWWSETFYLCDVCARRFIEQVEDELGYYYTVEDLGGTVQ